MVVLTHIFHLSDLHIRNGDNTYSRYEEYKEVFKNTIVSIKKQIENLELSYDNFIIVITGDIFHNKSVIGNYGLIMYRKFIQALSEIGRTYIISGNHDYDQSDINKPSLVYSTTFAIPNVFVLNTTTSFVIDDIGISFVSIDETLDNYRNSGRLQDLPQFPSISGNVRYKLALFHGSFAAAKLYNGKTVEDTFNPYPLEWVSDFDYVLLGDIHKRQVFSYKNKTICGYAGSLIQQNFGEDIVNHGYLIWDLYNKDIKKVNVYNDKGFINIRESESGDSGESGGCGKDILIRINGKYEKRLEDYIKDNIDIFPKNLDIKRFSNINIFNLKGILEKYNIKYAITERIDNFNNFITNKGGEKGDKGDNKEQDTDITEISSSCNEEIINNDALINYFKPLLTPENLLLLNKIIKNKELLLIDVENYPDELREECLKINKELMAVINTCNITDDTTIIPKSLYKIRYLEWEGLLCYENKSWLNMTELDSKIFMVRGQNGTGKSAIYDILLLAIWGENTKKSSITSGVVNHNKSKGYTIIDIDVLRDSAGDSKAKDTYRIIRNYTRKNIGNKLLVGNTVIYKKLEGEDMEIIKKDTACNAEIAMLFGNMEDFLATSMITQSIDCDILKMDFKSTLELIDKSFNIAYIYNLYNVFNKTINKYKGLHKYIESKKDVYEKLLLTSNYTENHGDDIEKMREDIELLKNANSLLIEEYNNCNIVLSNRNIELSPDTCEKYEGLKSKINLKKLVSRDTYDININRLTELEFILKGKDIIELSKASLDSSVGYPDTEEITKPCDISMIQNENNYLKEYFDIYDDNNSKYNTCEENDVIESLENIKNEYDGLEILAKSLIAEKPNKVNKIDKPIKARKECLNNIKQLFGSLEYMDEIIENIGSLNITPEARSTDTVIEDLSLENYKKCLEDRENLKNKIDDYNIRLTNNERLFDKYFKEQENIKIIGTPAMPATPAMLVGENNCANAEEVMREIEQIDYKCIIGFLKDNEECAEGYKEIMRELREAEEDRLKYAEELMLFENNEEYHFNPSCEYCCKRSWVGRIKELRIIIDRYDADISNIRNKLNINVNYEELIDKMETYKSTKDRYDILQEWYEYFKYKERRDKLNEKLNKLIENKKKYNKIISDGTKELENINKYAGRYYKKARELREHLDNIVNYEKYREWETQYNENTNKMNEIKENIKEYTEIANYNKNIKRRICEHRSLVERYNKWDRYNNYINIIHSREYLEIKEIQENYRNNEIYKGYKEVRPIIERVLELKEIIKDGEKTIIKQRDLMTEKAAIFNYNKANIKSLSELRDILDKINNMLTILETIIVNFQDFRINLYDNIVLKKLLRNTNKMLKNICHSITKPFELDYITNVSRDMIHINWLIKNVNIDSSGSGSSSGRGGGSNKQIISINQASGFQQFVISLALRLCLFGNNKAICKQLYIDEGFVSFDKYNLSIVPNFLKSLLAYFDTIVIVSHIDLIQDSIDDSECIVEINYNNKTSVSTLTYKTPIECSYVGKKKAVAKLK
jgi:DNA repair exonuclease SbcCD ATPase subunit/DNA repair exonuclease SbcCD nuclease subunit